MSLHNGGVAYAGERLVESKQLEWFRYATASWRGVRDGLFLERDSFDCIVFAADVGGSGHLNGGVALAPDPA
jgi:hypothetical protein